jgi:polyphosphate kinase
MPNTSQQDASLFISRDASWLSFNRRVLEEARDGSNPLLERVKFLAITASNLDEFIEVRIAGMLQRIEEGYGEAGQDGLAPQGLLDQITADMHDFVAEQYDCWNNELAPALEQAGIRVLVWGQLDEAARKAASDFYLREVDPLLTPITIDPRHPFPRVLNKALCIALLLRSKRRGKGNDAPVLGVVTVPRALPRFVRLPSGPVHIAGFAAPDGILSGDPAADYQTNLELANLKVGQKMAQDAHEAQVERETLSEQLPEAAFESSGNGAAGALHSPQQEFIFLHDLIEHHAGGMYRGYEILSTAAFRVTRNSNLYFEEEESRSLLEAVRSELHNRRKGDAVRLEIEQDAHPEIVDRLRSNFEIEDSQVYLTNGPVNLSRLMNLYGDCDRPDLKFPAFQGRELRLHRKSEDLFDELRNHDILLHHPYDSYEAVVSFIESAAADPDVISMKQTLYRTSDNSPIFRALTEAAQTKEVTVVVELTARFDEASNIRWARALEESGVQVFHGIVGLKTHCKLALLVRRDPDGEIRRYAHLGTGNYNPVTARFYTDISFLTSDPAITAGVHSVFNYLTAHSESDNYLPLLVAPLTLAQALISLIQRETEHARAGRPARIIAKMNSLLEQSVIEHLYEASQAGVEIDLIVRGICSIRPGLPRVSERIRVRSIVGRYLEHSRIFYFANGGKEEVYCGSADWMPRNLFERCEVVFPVRDPGLLNRLRTEILGAALADSVKTRLLRPDGKYTRLSATKEGRRMTPFDSQEFFMAVAEGRASVADIPDNQIPNLPPEPVAVVEPVSVLKAKASATKKRAPSRAKRVRKPQGEPAAETA